MNYITPEKTFKDSLLILEEISETGKLPKDRGFSLKLFCRYLLFKMKETVSLKESSERALDELSDKLSELENRIKENENGYAGTLFLERCKLHDAVEENKTLSEENAKLTAENDELINCLKACRSSHGGEVFEDAQRHASDEEFEHLKEDVDKLRRFIIGDWIDCEDIQRLLGIKFRVGFKAFDYSRTFECNDAPLNGQKATQKFKLSCPPKIIPF